MRNFILLLSLVSSSLSIAEDCKLVGLRKTCNLQNAFVNNQCSASHDIAVLVITKAKFSEDLATSDLIADKVGFCADRFLRNKYKLKKFFV